MQRHVMKGSALIDLSLLPTSQRYGNLSSGRESPFYQSLVKRLCSSGSGCHVPCIYNDTHAVARTLSSCKKVTRGRPATVVAIGVCALSALVRTDVDNHTLVKEVCSLATMRSENSNRPRNTRGLTDGRGGENADLHRGLCRTLDDSG